MEKNRIKYLLDFVPLVTISLYAMVSYWTMINANIELQWQHYLGIIFLILNFIVILINHQLGVLFLGFTLLLGLLTLLSFDVGIVNNWLSVTSAKVPVIYGHVISLIWLMLHFILSGRYYVGIATRNYWKLLLKKNTEPN